MSVISNTLESLASSHGVAPLDMLEMFLERAAIREYDGGFSRPDAERLALEDIQRELEGRR